MFSASLLASANLRLKAPIALVTSFNVCSFLYLNAIVRELKLGKHKGKLLVIDRNLKE